MNEGTVFVSATRSVLRTYNPKENKHVDHWENFGTVMTYILVQSQKEKYPEKVVVGAGEGYRFSSGDDISLARENGKSFPPHKVVAVETDPDLLREGNYSLWVMK